jgi:uncharacterized protein YcgI (DUF1989 family)
MANYLENEVEVGAVIFLDPDVLRSNESASTTAGKGMAVKGSHYFVVIALNGPQVTMAPLFSDNPSQGRVPLDPALKSGSEARWSGSDSYLDKHQCWSADVRDVCTASSVDATSPGSRNSYGGATNFAAIFPPMGSSTWRSLYRL